MPSQKIKVQRTHLIEAVRARLESEQSEFAAAKEQWLEKLQGYASTKANWHRAVADWIDRHPPSLVNVIGDYHSKEIRAKTGYPQEPEHPGYPPKDPDNSKHVKILRMLEMSQDETIAVSIDSDLGEYL